MTAKFTETVYYTWHQKMHVGFKLIPSLPTVYYYVGTLSLQGTNVETDVCVHDRPAWLPSFSRGQ